MCIIAYKPVGAKFPTKNQFKTMFRNNPDGAGFMFSDGDSVTIKKGFMTYSEFRNAFAPYKDMTDNAFVFHFRIATHGGVNEAMTQPFPLSAKSKKLRSTDTRAAVGIAHNGIIPLTTDARKMSDTAAFIRDYMTRIYNPQKGFDDITLNIIESCIASRMVILEPSGVAHILGHGWKKSGGLYFSNDSYIDYFSTAKKAKKTAALYSTWDNGYSFGDMYDWCDGECNACRLFPQCWDTSAPTDGGINSIY